MNLFNEITEYISGENIHLALIRCNIKIRLTYNLKISNTIQLILARDDNWKVRDYLSDNVNLCKEAQIILATDPLDLIKAALSRNRNLCEEARKILGI